MARGLLFTLGHSTRSGEDLVGVLRAHGIRRLVDVRSIPGSRHNPQFNRFSATNAKPHALTPMAKVRGTQVTYP